MVLEGVLSTEKAERHTYLAVVYGFIGVLIAALLSVVTMEAYSSIMVVAVAALITLPFIFNIIRKEEAFDMKTPDEVSILKHHEDALKAMMGLFIGFTLAFAGLFALTPWETNTNLFESQLETLQNIRSPSGMVAAAPSELPEREDIIINTDLSEYTKNNIIKFRATIPASYNANTVTWYVDNQAALRNADPGDVFEHEFSRGGDHDVSLIVTDTDGEIYAAQKLFNLPSDHFQRFTTIFLNNTQVLMWCMVFSFVLGSGAIFILSWNASVIGVAIGDFIRSNLAAASATGGAGIVEYFTIITTGLLKYVIHGVPEILGYFIAALAATMISIGVINHDYESTHFDHVVSDAAVLIIIAVVTLFFAGILEVYVTPRIF